MIVLCLAGDPRLQGNRAPLERQGEEGILKGLSLLYDRELYWWEDSNF